MITDYWFRCGSAMFTNSESELGAPAYFYRYDHAPSFKDLWPQFGLPTACEDKVCHMAEIPFIFNNYANFSSLVTPHEYALSTAMGELWTSFAKTHVPSSATAGTTWQPHNASTRE